MLHKLIFTLTSKLLVTDISRATDIISEINMNARLTDSRICTAINQPINKIHVLYSIDRNNSPDKYFNSDKCIKFVFLEINIQ